ncbi:PREDICTED: natural cytotoxicity triggering receptor 2 [Chinchilla lanigera]|uniref:natural cytotoxicity triggering receptor 2 n=1 Tax=Chinchilla lanigera TaxID=34839 RepID=UPI00069905EB|nr:PREDICTED: natural cytotoxicity triggering receptor 2 [Chinchilla lanigera]
MRHTSSNTVFNSVKFHLAVLPAPTRAPRAACTPSSPQSRSSAPPAEGVTEALEAAPAFTTSAWPRNATFCPGPEAPCALGPGLCGLLLTKSLALGALLWQVLCR